MDHPTDLLYGPWPWYIAGPLMGASIPILLFWANKMLGASASLRHLCAMLPNNGIDYFQYDVKEGFWNVLFALGVLLGGGITYAFFYQPEAVQIAASTQADLHDLGLTDFSGLMPSEIFAFNHLWSIRGLSFTIGGGFLLGFGVRYAGGCTSGHGFMGLSQLSISSLIAILAFFIGGILCTHFFLPILI